MGNVGFENRKIHMEDENYGENKRVGLFFLLLTSAPPRQSDF